MCRPLVLPQLGRYTVAQTSEVSTRYAGPKARAVAGAGQRSHGDAGVGKHGDKWTPDIAGGAGDQNRCHDVVLCIGKRGAVVTAANSRNASAAVVVRAAWASCQRSRTPDQSLGGAGTDQPCCALLIGTLIAALIAVAVSNSSRAPTGRRGPFVES